jgi:hypothetical protein
LLTGHDGSSVVVDYLCDQAIEQDMAVACFYYDFASREAQSPTNMLGSLLKQLLSGLGAIPVEIVQKFRGQKKVIGGRRLQLPDIVKMLPLSHLYNAHSSVLTLSTNVFQSIRWRFLMHWDKFSGVAKYSNVHDRKVTYPGAVERELGGRATSVSIKPRDDDIVTYLRARLRKDTTPEVMDSGLENDIMKSIPEEISETYVVAGIRETFVSRILIGANTDSYWFHSRSKQS